MTFFQNGACCPRLNSPAIHPLISLYWPCLTRWASPSPPGMASYVLCFLINNNNNKKTMNLRVLWWCYNEYLSTGKDLFFHLRPWRSVDVFCSKRMHPPSFPLPGCVNTTLISLTPHLQNAIIPRLVTDYNVRYEKGHASNRIFFSTTKVPSTIRCSDKPKSSR